jgi:molybdenum cofactor biosynthesis protein MoaC
MQKIPTMRIARASAIVHIGKVAAEMVGENQIRKGDVLTTAQLAGIMGAKHTSMLIPLCHNVNISKAYVNLHLHAEIPAVVIKTEVSTVGQTGVEMEALTAASVAALTVFDMCKAVTKEMVISDLQLDFKSGGKSGVYDRDAGLG